MSYVLERQGATLGQSYKNDKACADFINYTVADQMLKLLNKLSKLNFFSVQSDASADSGIVEFLIFYFNPYTEGFTLEN